MTSAYFEKFAEDVRNGSFEANIATHREAMYDLAMGVAYCMKKLEEIERHAASKD